MSKLTSEDPFIELRELTKVYLEGDQERTVFAHANAVIRRGEFVVLVGRSGSGKSTLLNLISGIDLPTSGDVIVNDIRLAKLSERERTLFRRKQVGFVFQFFNLIPTLTVEENLLLPLELKGRVGKTEHSKVLELLETVGLADRAKSFPDRLSGGELQRIAIARAVVHDPPLILADEPTGNLDADTGQEVVELLNRVTREDGKTMVMVTHSTDWLGLADRVLVVQEGRLVERHGEVRQ